jgi:Rieske Fe-S protein
MERRKFLKTSCSVCLLIGAGVMMDTLSSCTTTSVYKTIITENKIAVPISLFTDKDFQIVRPSNFEYDIAMRKEMDGSYSALLMQCTHADNQLNSTGKGFFCNLHGSRFNMEGGVTKGPAARSLKKYATTIISDTIVISIHS